MMTPKLDPSAALWRQRLHEIIFEADTPAGKAFDVAVLGGILLSVLTVMLESVPHLRTQYGSTFSFIEWVCTLLFSLEYLLRLLSVRRPLRYALSFFGVVDLLAILPAYLSLLVPGSHYLAVIRILRLLRIFRILKLGAYLDEATILR
ncbi:MAG TPA: ion transporter, partial [Herpetosiphonaceae bacterium]